MQTRRASTTSGPQAEMRKIVEREGVYEESDNEEEEDEPQEDYEEPEGALYCICRKSYDADIFMIQCDKCKEWYHGECIDIDEGFSKRIDKYFCFKCQGNRDTKDGFCVLKRKRARRATGAGVYASPRGQQVNKRSRTGGYDQVNQAEQERMRQQQEQQRELANQKQQREAYDAQLRQRIEQLRQNHTQLRTQYAQYQQHHTHYQQQDAQYRQQYNVIQQQMSALQMKAQEAQQTGGVLDPTEQQSLHVMGQQMQQLQAHIASISQHVQQCAQAMNTISQQIQQHNAQMAQCQQQRASLAAGGAIPNQQNAAAQQAAHQQAQVAAQQAAAQQAQQQQQQAAGQEAPFITPSRKNAISAFMDIFGKTQEQIAFCQTLEVQFFNQYRVVSEPHWKTETKFDMPTISQVLDDAEEVAPIGQAPAKEAGNEYERHMLLALHRLARYHHLRGLVGQSKISPQDFAALSEEKVMTIQQQGVARRGVLQRVHAVIQEPTLSHRMEELLFVRSNENLDSFLQQADAVERFLTEHADVVQQLRGQQIDPEHCLQMAVEANPLPTPPVPGAPPADTPAETKAGEDPQAAPAATPQDGSTAAPAVVSSSDDTKDGDAASSWSPASADTDAAPTVTDAPPEGTVAVSTNGVDADAVQTSAATSTPGEPMKDATADSSTAGATTESSSSTAPSTNGDITNPEDSAGASAASSSSRSTCEKSEPSSTSESNAMNDVHPTPTKAPDDAVASLPVAAAEGGESAAAAAQSTAEENSAATADGFLS